MTHAAAQLPRDGIIAAAFTPMRSDGAPATEQIRPLVEHLRRDGVAGLFVNGTTGEGPSLTGGERRDVAEAFVDAAGGAMPVIVHVGHDALDEARALAEHARRIGADAIAATPPHYYKPHDPQTLTDCLRRVGEATPELPLLYYHIPHLTGVEVDVPDWLERHAERLPTLAGVKFTAPRLWQFQTCLDRFGDRLRMYWGIDEMLAGALSVGARAAVSGGYNFAAPLYRRILEAHRRGDSAAVRTEQGRSAALMRLLGQHGHLPAMKAVMELIGVPCGPCRLPLRSLEPADREALRGDLERLGFFTWSDIDAPG